MSRQMSEDRPNGLHIVSLRPDDPWKERVAASGSRHPLRWHQAYVKCRDPPEHSTKPPGYYENRFRSSDVDVEIQETIRFMDVEHFRKTTADVVNPPKEASNIVVAVINFVVWLFNLMWGLFNPVRPVIYRYVDAILGGNALLEAVHFELFEPGRSDLRFLVVPAKWVSGATEDDFFRVSETGLLITPRSSVKLGKTEYPVVWMATRLSKIELEQEGREEMAYILPSTCSGDGLRAISESLDTDFPIHLALSASSSGAHSLVYASTRASRAPRLYAIGPFQADFGHVALRPARVGRAARALTAAEKARIDDRLGRFAGFGNLPLQQTLFRLGARFRVYVDASRGRRDDDEDEVVRVDDSVVLTTLVGGGDLEATRATAAALYSASARFVDPTRLRGCADVERTLDGLVRLNDAQRRAVRAYADADGPRVLAVRSPPGSGKTTVAAAMAAGVACTKGRNVGVQLLMSVQNVAVDNIGEALKKMGVSGAGIYNMKSKKKLDPADPVAFDIFDGMNGESLQEWTKKKARNDYEDALWQTICDHERQVRPSIILATVEMVLYKMAGKSRLANVMANVRKVVIDEASLLTEAALFCIIRRFPGARIVLIGDDKQLPPFMYEPGVLGHELAGRPALSVAMKSGRVPVVELNEVYRAPPSLVAPYNRLAYGGRLRSGIDECEKPLSEMRLIASGAPQLLLVDVNGMQARSSHSKSLHNEKEAKALQRLLARFPAHWRQAVMIICLYKEQKRRLHQLLGNKYPIHTVDSAQGKEKGIVILMTTRTQAAESGTFFNSVERCNVAVSRQQKALIIVGKGPLLTKIHPWSTVVNGDDFTRIKAEKI